MGEFTEIQLQLVNRFPRIWVLIPVCVFRRTSAYLATSSTARSRSWIPSSTRSGFTPSATSTLGRKRMSFFTHSVIIWPLLLQVTLLGCHFVSFYITSRDLIKDYEGELKRKKERKRKQPTTRIRTHDLQIGWLPEGNWKLFRLERNILFLYIALYKLWWPIFGILEFRFKVCCDWFHIFSFHLTGIPERKVKNRLMLYPWPVSGVVMILFHVKVIGIKDVKSK